MRAARPCGSVGVTERVRIGSTRRNGTVKLIFMIVLVPREVQRNGSCCSVVADFFHQCANQQPMILLERLPQGFRNIQLLACPAIAQRGSKLIEDRIFDHACLYGFGGTGVPPVLSCRFTYVVAIPPTWLGRVGGYHRSLAALADQQTCEQRILWHANRCGSDAAAAT